MENVDKGENEYNMRNYQHLIQTFWQNIVNIYRMKQTETWNLNTKEIIIIISLTVFLIHNARFDTEKLKKSSMKMQIISITDTLQGMYYLGMIMDFYTCKWYLIFCVLISHIQAVSFTLGRLYIYITVWWRFFLHNQSICSTFLEQKIHVWYYSHLLNSFLAAWGFKSPTV